MRQASLRSNVVANVVGLGITALIVLGLVGAGSFFWIWMAFVAGGGLRHRVLVEPFA